MTEIPVEAEARIEMLAGRLAGILSPSRALVEALQLRGNASAQTRSSLDYLIQMTGVVWELLGKANEETQGLRAEIQSLRTSFMGHIAVEQELHEPPVQ
jgi:hypothetical protein